MGSLIKKSEIKNYCKNISVPKNQCLNIEPKSTVFICGEIEIHLYSVERQCIHWIFFQVPKSKKKNFNKYK